MLRCIIMNKNKVLTVGPDIKGFGGISSVLRSYRSFVPGFTYLPTNSRKGMLAGALSCALSFLRMPFYRLCGYGIVHAHAAAGKSFYRKRVLLNWARFWGYRTIYHCHAGAFRNFVEHSDRTAIVSFLKRCSAVCVLTEGWRHYFVDDLGCDNVFVLNNPIESPKRAAQRVVKSEKPPVKFVFIGKIIADKGLLDLVAAVASEHEYFKNRATMTIAGNADEINMQGVIDKAGVGDIVKFIGPVFGDAKDALLRDSDVLLLPSYFEGMPITLLEAGAYRMPSIATRVGGIPEVIEDGVNGLLIDAGDTQALAAAMKHYIENRNDIYSHGQHASESVRSFYPDAIAKSLDAVYSSLMK